MDALQSFCDGFKLEVNYKNTKCMTFTKGNHREKLTFKLKNTNSENVKEFKYLGVIISTKYCSFQPNLKELSKKGLKAVFALNSKIKLTQLPVKVALNIFDAAILPILLCGREIWRFSLQTKARQRNIKYIKYLRSKSNDELAKHALLYEETKSTSRGKVR